LFVPGAGLAECPDDIVAYWKLDEASGPTYSDFVGSNDGQGDANPLAVADGKVNGAQEFASGLGINVPPNRAFNWSGTDSFSIELWMKTDQTPPENINRVLIGRGTPGLDAGVLWYVGLNEGDGRPLFYLREEDNSRRKLTGTKTVLSDGEWHHIVAMWDATTKEQSIYVDGLLEPTTSDNLGASMTLGFATPKDLNIGHVDNSFRYVGLIDEIAVYDRVLPESEIQERAGSDTDYCAGAAAPDAGAAFAPFPDDTVALWPLDESGGSTYVDAFAGIQGEGNASPTAVAEGKVNGAQQFGAGLGIDVPASKAFNWGPSDSFSIELWMMTDVVPEGGINQVLVGRGTLASGVLWWLGLDAASGGAPAFFLREEDGSSRKVVGATLLPNTGWRHLVATWDGETGLQGLYVDGEIEPTTPTDVGNMTLGFATSASLNIANVADRNRYAGMIDELAIYDRVLPQSEIQGHVAAGNDGKGVQTLRPAPTADAGSDQSVAEGGDVTLSGSGTPGEGYVGDGSDIVAYRWEQTDGTSVTLTDADQASASFTAPSVDSDEALTFQLTVTAADGQESEPATTTVTVTAEDDGGDGGDNGNGGTPPPASSDDGGGGGCFINSMF
jgi:hypothetical protein